METTWKPCVITWKPHGIHMETKWCPHGNHMVSRTCLELGLKISHLISIDGNDVLFMVRHHKMETTSFQWVEMMSVLCGNQVISMACLDCGLKLVWKLQILWFPCSFHVISIVSTRTPCGFQVNTMVSNVEAMWFPGRDIT